MKLLNALKEVVGAEHVRTGGDIPDRNRADASELPPVMPLALVRPGNTQEVARVLKLCNEAGQPVVVQGGMTGLAGGAHPREPEIALSLERLTGIEEIDRESRTMIVRAGTPLYQVQDAAREAGLHYGVDLGARGSCTIGGNVATNAGGVQALRYGVTRRQVLGIEAVLADGTVLSALNKLPKNNTGYDWPQLMIGAEGTLGVITRVSLALVPAPRPPQTALLAVAGIAEALQVLNALEARFPAQLLTFEGMWREYLEVTARLGTMAEPFAERPEITLLVEVALGDGGEAQDALAEALGELMERGVIADALIAQSLQDRQRFWAYREANYEFYKVMPPAEHFDVSLPANRIGEAVEHLRRDLAARLPGAIFVAYGHLGDSNLHLAVYPLEAGPDVSRSEAVIYDAVGLFNGSISAEHGIGILKRPYLPKSRSADELSLMRALKKVFDPHGILNPGRILELG